MQELKSSDHMCSDLGRVAHDMSTRKVEFGGVPELGVGWLDRKVQLIEIPEGLEIPKVRLEKFDPLRRVLRSRGRFAAILTILTIF